MRRLPRRLERRAKTEDEAADDREGDCDERFAPPDGHRLPDLEPVLREPCQPADHDRGDADARGTGHDSEDAGFDHQLPDDGRAPASECQPRRHLATSPGSSCQHQSSEVDARRDEHHGDRRPDDEERRPYRCRHALLQSDEAERDFGDVTGGFSRGGALPLHLLRDARQLRDDRGTRRLVTKSNQDLVVGPATLARGRRPQRRPEIGARPGLKSLGHDADDGVGFAAERDGTAHGGWIAAECRAPEFRAQDDCRRAAGAILVGGEFAAGQHRDAEHREKAGAHALLLNEPGLFGSVRPADDEIDAGGPIREDGPIRARHVVAHELPRPPIHRRVARHLATLLDGLRQEREPFGMRVGQRLEEDGVDERKDRRVDADRQREREDGGQREGWCAPEDAARVADVQPRCLDESKR